MRGSVAAVCIALLCTGSGALAQNRCVATGVPASCVTSKDLDVIVRSAVRVVVTPASLNLGSPSVMDFTQGYSQAVGHDVEVRANGAWQLMIRTSQSRWTATGTGRTNKPREDLQWSLGPAGPFTSISGNGGASNQLVASGSGTTSTNLTLYYRVLWDWALDSPGGYTLPIVFTISAP